MALLPSLNKPGAVAPKSTKTKAKQRYLKAKKNRAKKKKPAGQANSEGKSAQDALNIAQSDEDSSDADSSDSDAVEPTNASEVSASAEAPRDVDSAKENRPKKRRKVENPPNSQTSTLPTHDVSMEDTVDEPSQQRAPEVHDIPIEELPSLPRFPLPRQPDAPSAAVLYLQGVDEALIEAEVVDPARTVALSQEPSVDDESGLSAKTRQRLSQLGITELFAVQTAILPFLLPPQSSRTSRSLYTPYNQPRDVCISAPTGSGKTLAYVLPIVETLSTRVVTRLRALVVLPTRDLVSQVRETFEALCKGRNLKIGVATGQHSFSQEQTQLVGEPHSRLDGGHSKVDILVCTPGRLMDHLQGTPNFTLQHLRFLVIDEADRLVTEAFQDWLAQVLAATHPSPTTNHLTPAPSTSTSISSSIPYPDALHPAWLSSSSNFTSDLSIAHPPRSSCQKLLFSATLTRDPSKIAALDLHDPKYFVVGSDGAIGANAGASAIDETTLAGETFAFPATLREHMLVCETALKPLMLLHLMHTRSLLHGSAPAETNSGVRNALVFTKSAESTARLVKLITAFEDSFTSSTSSTAAEEVMEIDGDVNGAKGANVEYSKEKIVAEAYSSDLSASQRKSILERFKNAEIGILVCSDLISRGIDISHVSHVVSYDAPIDMRKYVHRVGRTARAGREGDAWSLVEEQEARHFKKMMSDAAHLDRLRKVKASEKMVKPLIPHYEHALKELKAAFGRE
ncbi:DEAD-domain-containing protein [Clavulina sp. PMI_390]|nr:DEAD-domain-containing protein [Clavulina sp. PMI_390]